MNGRNSNSSEQTKKKSFFSGLLGKGGQNREENKEEDVDFSYSELNNCFYQRYNLIQKLYYLTQKKREEPNNEQDEENNNDNQKEKEKETSK